MPVANKKKVSIGLLAAATIAFLGSLYVNCAYIHPNSYLKYGVSGISDKYMNLLTPTAFTFRFWSVICVLGMLALVFWWIMFFQASGAAFSRQKKSIVIFTLAAIFNSLWVIFWIQDKILLSWVMIFILLILLSVEYFLTRKIHSKTGKTSYLFFNTYFGWITVAFAVNTLATLVSLGWQPMDVEAQYVTVFVLLLISGLGLYMMWVKRNYFFSLPVVWAFFGIYVKHRQLPGSYPIATNSLVMMFLLLVSVAVYRVAEKYKNYQDNF